MNQVFNEIGAHFYKRNGLIFKWGRQSICSNKGTVFHALIHTENTSDGQLY